MNMHSLIVSVIIPAYNEENTIGRCIESVLRGNFPAKQIEIIVVDNGSTDHTAGIASALGAKVIDLPSASVGGLRNSGARAARGEILAFLDADCIAAPDWIESAITALNEQDGITGSRYYLPSAATWLEKAWCLEPPKARIPTNYINSGNCFIRRTLFLSLAGFNESLAAGEDTEFCLRARLRDVPISSNGNIKVRHLGYPKNIAQFILREIWHGLGALGTFKLKHFDKPLIGTVIFALISATQIVGLVLFISGFGSAPFLFASLALLGLLALCVIYRAQHLRGIIHILQLGFLFYLYFLARTISFLFLLSGKQFRRKK